MKIVSQVLVLCVLMSLSITTLAQSEKPICPSTADIMRRIDYGNIMSFSEISFLPGSGEYYGHIKLSDNFNTNTNWIFTGEVWPHSKLIPNADVARELFRNHMNSHINYRPEAKYILNSVWFCGYGPAPYNDERDDIDGIMYTEMVTDRPRIA